MYRILSLDGGGIRALMCAVVLVRLERLVPGWLNQVDLFAGTSSGGILALCLAKGLRPATILDNFYRLTPEIFRKPSRLSILRRHRLFRPIYDGRRLQNFLDGFLGGTRLSSLPCSVLVTAYELDNDHPDEGQRTWAPKMFHNLGYRHNGADISASKAAYYTSTSPTIFASYDGYVDGGVIASNPGLVALSHALDPAILGPNRPDLSGISLLSLGTGDYNFYVEGKSHKWGLWQWRKLLFEIMVEGGVRLVDHQCRQMLGRRYRRISPPLTEKYQADEWQQRDALLDISLSVDLEETAAWLRNDWGATRVELEPDYFSALKAHRHEVYSDI